MHCQLLEPESSLLYPSLLQTVNITQQYWQNSDVRRHGQQLFNKNNTFQIPVISNPMANDSTITFIA